MYLSNDNFVDKSNVCISTKVNMSTLYIDVCVCVCVYLKPYIIYYTSSLSRMTFFNINFKYDSSYSPKTNPT
jgi:hypothetical protein